MSQLLQAFMNMFLNVAACLAFTFAGVAAGRHL